MCLPEPGWMANTRITPKLIDEFPGMWNWDVYHLSNF